MNIIASITLWALLGLGPVPVLAGETHFSILELPSVEGQAGPQVAVRWAGELPVRVEFGIAGEHGFAPLGAPTTLTEKTTLLARPETEDQVLALRILDGHSRVLVETQVSGIQSGWQSRFIAPGMDEGAVWTSVIYQGELIVSGTFNTAGLVETTRIARWDGTQWTSIGGPTNILGIVDSLAVYNGELIAGGTFTQIAGTTVNRIARWNGSQWLPLEGPEGIGVDGDGGGVRVLALAVYDNALYAGGIFTTAGDVTVNRIARWDGSEWSALSGSSGTGFTALGAEVRALAVYDDALIVGGKFGLAGGVSANNLARWDGSEWAPLQGPSGNGVSGTTGTFVATLATYGAELIVGGWFNTAGGLPANRIARWDGSEWRALIDTVTSANGVNSTVLTLTVFDGALIAGGDFTSAGGQAALRIARWDGATWSPAGATPGGGFDNWVSMLAVYDGALIAGGFFVRAEGTEVNRIARLNDGIWAPLPALVNSSPNGPVNALATYNGDLIVAGDFTSAGDQPVGYIARWDGSQWWPLGPGLNWTVNALTVFDGALIAGGWFGSAGNVPVNRVARWDGSEWSALAGASGVGTSGVVRALGVFDGALIVGGIFTTAGAIQVNNIARWDGAEWSALAGPSGIGVSQGVWALTSFDGALIAGGAFNRAGGVNVNFVARWNGSDWSALGGQTPVGMNDRVSALAVYDEQLVAAGLFNLANGETVNGIARFDGNRWWPLEGPAGNGFVGAWGMALAVFNGDLIAAGSFSAAGGVLANNIARWDGQAWSPLAGPLNAGVNKMARALLAHENELIAGGEFTAAGGLASRHVAAFLAGGLTVGGSVSGLKLPGLVLDLNGVSALLFDRDGTFTFPASLANGSSYQVTVLIQPRDHDCIVANGSGTIAGAGISDVAVSCQTDIAFADDFEDLLDSPVPVNP